MQPLHWVNLLPGTYVELINMHGDADLFTTKTRFFPDTPDGNEDYRMLLETIDSLYESTTIKNREGEVYDVCVAISESTNYTDIEALLEVYEPLLEYDIRYSDAGSFFAEPTAYRILKVSASGVSTYAVFPSTQKKHKDKTFRYYKISPHTDDRWLKDWA